MDFSRFLDSLSLAEQRELYQLLSGEGEDDRDREEHLGEVGESKETTFGSLNCELHFEQAIGYCETCKRCICELCIPACVSHKLTPSMELLSRIQKKKNILNDFKSNINEITSKLADNLTQSSESCQARSERLSQIKSLVERRNEIVEGELKLMERSYEFLRCELEGTKSEVVKGRIKAAMEKLQVRDFVDREANNLEQEVVGTLKSIISSRREIASYSQMMTMLDVISQIDEGRDGIVQLTEQEILAILICEPALRDTVKPQYTELPAFSEALTKLDSNAMSDTCGIFFNVSEPLKWKSKSSHSGDIVASLCKTGVLTTFWIGSNEVEVVDLFSDKSFKITQIKGLTTPVHNDGAVYLFTDKEKRVFHLHVLPNQEDVVVGSLQTTEYPGCVGVCDTTSTNSYNTVKFIDTGNCVNVCELPSMASRKLANVSAVPVSICPGICPTDVQCFYYDSERRVRAVLGSGKETVVGIGKGNVLCYIPSTTLPDDLANGLLLATGGSVCNSREISPSFNVKLVGRLSLVNVMENLYLVYDGNTSDWRLLRIFVP